MGEFIEPVSPDMIPSSAPLSAIKKQLEDAGVSLDEADMDAAITIFQNMYRPDAKDNVIVLWRKGKRQMYQVAPDVYRAMTAIDQQFQLSKILDIVLGVPTRMIRLGATGLRPAFSMITNPLRDVMTATMQTRTTGWQGQLPSVVVRSVGGIVHDIMGTETARLFKAGGGEMAQPLSIDRQFTQEALHEILAVRPKDKVLNWSRHPVDTMRELFSVTELGPRLAEFEAILRQKGWKPGQDVTFEQYVSAQAAAADVTVDFREGGSYAMWINRLVAFFNASIQGPNRFVQAMRQRPISTTLKAIAWITLPSVILWWRNKDEEWYKNLPAHEKARYWHVKIGKSIIRIPKPFEPGMIFGTSVEGMLDSWYNNDPKYAKEALQQTAWGLVPPVVPSAIKPVVEVAANRDFFRDAPIVSQSLQNQRPEDQYYDRTSETARKVGKLFGVAPANVEHLIYGYTSGLGMSAINAGEDVLRSAGVLPKKGQSPPMLADMPVIGRLFLRETTTRVFDDFYTKLAELNADSGSARAGKAEGLNPKDSLLRNRMEAVSDRLADIRKEMKKDLEGDDGPDVKLKRILAFHRRMKTIAAAALAGKPVFSADFPPKDEDELKFAHTELFHAEAAGQDIDAASARLDGIADKLGLPVDPTRNKARGAVATYYGDKLYKALKAGDDDAAKTYWQARETLGYSTDPDSYQDNMAKDKLPEADQERIIKTLERWRDGS